MSITENWKIVDSIPARRSPETEAAYAYFKDMKTGTTVHVDKDSASTAKRAASLLHKDHEEIQIRFRTAAEGEGGGVYATKISG